MGYSYDNSKGNSKKTRNDSRKNYIRAEHLRRPSHNPPKTGNGANGETGGKKEGTNNE